MIIYDQIFKKYGLSPTQQEIIKIVGLNKIVLEIGSSTGYMTRAFLDNGCLVDIVEINKEAAKKTPKKIRKMFNESIESKILFDKLPKDYDFIIMADVLEHLVNPGEVLLNLSNVAARNTQLLVSMANIASWVMRKQLFFKGDFEYQDSGLLDKTHLHFYSVYTLPRILSNNGWKVENNIGTVIKFPFEETMTKIPICGIFLKKIICSIFAEKFKNLFYYHFLVLAKKEEYK